MVSRRLTNFGVCRLCFRFAGKMFLLNLLLPEEHIRLLAIGCCTRMDHFGIVFVVSGTHPSFISSIDTRFAACGFVFVEQKGHDSLSVLEHSEAWSDNLQVVEDKGNFWRLVGFGAVYRVCIALCIALSL